MQKPVTFLTSHSLLIRMTTIKNRKVLVRMWGNWNSRALGGKCKMVQPAVDERMAAPHNERENYNVI